MANFPTSDRCSDGSWIPERGDDISDYFAFVARCTLVISVSFAGDVMRMGCYSYTCTTESSRLSQPIVAGLTLFFFMRAFLLIPSFSVNETDFLES